MLFEEHIERIKKKFSVTDFRVPFVDAREVLGKIERKFVGGRVIETNSTIFWRSPNWIESLEDKTELGRVSVEQIEQFLNVLDRGKNYWIVVARGESPFLEYYVYDVRLNAMIELISICAGDFFVVEKKYNWLISFSSDKKKGIVIVSKSGSHETPFDRKN